MSGQAVLVVDPAPHTADRVGQALAGTAFSMLVAKDGGEAEELLAKSRVAAEVATLTFPRGNGYELARAVRARSPEAVVFLVCGGFDIYNQERATEAGVTGRIARPVSVEAMRRYLEAALGPLGDGAANSAGEPLGVPPGDESLPEVEPSGLEPIDGTISGAFIRPLRPPEPQPAVGDERVATFLPRDWRSFPPVKVDAAVVGPAMERAILAILPEVVEAVINKAIATSPAFREMLEVAVEEVVRQELPAIARKAVRDRMAELEAGNKSR